MWFPIDTYHTSAHLEEWGYFGGMSIHGQSRRLVCRSIFPCRVDLLRRVRRAPFFFLCPALIPYFPTRCRAGRRPECGDGLQRRPAVGGTHHLHGRLVHHQLPGSRGKGQLPPAAQPLRPLTRGQHDSKQPCFGTQFSFLRDECATRRAIHDRPSVGV